MKKIFLVLVSMVASVGMASAQNECMTFFPTAEGAVLVSKSYDAGNNLLGTISYVVESSYDASNNMVIGFTMLDNRNQMVDQGKMKARCDDGDFYMSMNNRTWIPDAPFVLSSETQLVENFLDYPMVDEANPYFGPLGVTESEITLQSKEDRDQVMTLRTYNREYDKFERITTPAGDFDAAKVTFMVEVREPSGLSTVYKGAEWYAAGAGIVRTEIYDMNNNLKNYTVLTDMENI